VAVEVAMAGEGRGVFAAREFMQGETVIVGKAIEYPATVSGCRCNSIVSGTLRWTFRPPC
jgi:hypothetical protein